MRRTDGSSGGGMHGDHGAGAMQIMGVMMMMVVVAQRDVMRR